MTDTDLAILDFETTGIDPCTDRIVSGYTGILHDGAAGEGVNILVRPDGYTIPAGSTAVHGITTAHATAHGGSFDEEISGILRFLRQRPHLPLAGMNIAYDLTILHTELYRAWTPAAAERAMRCVMDRPILDALVLDRALYPYRRGSRRLEDLAPLYGVQFDGDAHGARADAIVAGQIVAHQLTNPALSGYSIDSLRDAQVRWKAQQAASLESFLRRKDPSVVVDPGWPLLTSVAVAA